MCSQRGSTAKPSIPSTRNLVTSRPNNMSKADLIIHGGSIISMDEIKPFPEAIAVKNGKIIAVGIKSDVLKLGDEETEYVELKGKETLLPGFIEPHQHATQMVFNRCLMHVYINCGAYYYETYDQIKNLIQTTVDNTDPDSGKWCLFLGWDPEMIPTLPKLNFSVLDSFSKDVPILIIGQSGHVGWGNTKPFQLAKIPDNVENPEGGVFVTDDAGKLTGQMLESPAMMMVMKHAPLPTPEELSIALDEQWTEYAKCGFTTVTDMAYMPTDVDPLIIQKASRPDCPLRLALYALKYGPGDDESKGTKVTCCKLANHKERRAKMLAKSDKLWFAGVKICADGSPHCGTAAVREPYHDTDLTRLLCFPPSPCYGTLNYDDESILKTVKYWHDHGYQIAAHAHGERAIEQVLSAYQQVTDVTKDLDRRHRMEHLGLCDENHIKAASKLNLAFSFFVEHLFFYAKAYSESIFGKKRTSRWTPLSLATKHDLRWTIHQDHPTFPLPPEPLVNMKTAVTRTRKGEPNVVYGEEYCVPIEEALKAYTINAAWQIHKDKELGSLTVGKQADLVILSDNPLKVDVFKLGDIKVVNTYLDGQSNKLNQ
ncbi:uncharacterized protein LOC116298816 [Actinia tenebrosa]|uniref:Uncharacterized protein LOC116298816 n=1 Tax=Actinia tenebrosa TaxID=6105 RepID=A0A6P8I5M8_ACTTE|nr:uncharacterized protein LOC116298816 [Actinia tenebrosa]